MDTPSPSQTPVARVVAASFIGTAIEWYDFFLYNTAAALVFPTLFFPTIDPVAGTMAAFATHALGFARPVGGVLFGHFGDRVGRKSALVTTLMLVGLSTFFIGLLPTYHDAGVLAPVLLVVLRLVQGLGVGGEWGGAVLMVAERGDPRWRGFSASWVQAGAPAGMLLASGIFGLASMLPEADFLSWGWRIPFLLGVVLTVVGLVLRVKLLESPLFAKMLADEKPNAGLPILEVLRRYRRNVLLAMGARIAENGFYYFFTVVALSYGTQQLGLPRSLLIDGVTLSAVVHLVVTPMFGALSDRVGRRPVYLSGAVFLGAFAYPFFWMVGTRETHWVWLAITIGMVGHAAMYGPQAAFLSELFGTRVRYSGVSFGYQLAAPLSGGLVPLVATALLRWSDGAPWPVVVYLVAMALVTVVAVLLAAETKSRELGDENPNADDKESSW